MASGSELATICEVTEVPLKKFADLDIFTVDQLRRYWVSNRRELLKNLFGGKLEDREDFREKINKFFNIDEDEMDVDDAVADNVDTASLDNILPDDVPDNVDDLDSNDGDAKIVPISEYNNQKRTRYADIVDSNISSVDNDPYYSSSSAVATAPPRRRKYIGLRNQGATCYLNSLLQTLFHLAYFRAGIYRMDTEEIANAKDSIPLALQKLFFNLEFGEDSASTSELTASFGWNHREAAVQHDIQELLRVLCDTLSEKMAKADAKNNTVRKLFRGEEVYYTRCLDIDYESRRCEEIYDVVLVVKGNRGVMEAFEQYTKEETLDSKYEVEKEGKKTYHPAVRGCIFRKLPPVLILHLRRFDFDYTYMRQIKINDRFEFEEEIDLTKFVEQPGPPHCASDELGRQGTDQSMGSRQTTFFVEPEERYIYTLHSVMVHSGTSYGGHYTCFIRPERSGGWYKFNDSMVTEATADEAIRSNYGGRMKDSWGREYDQSSSAYLLTYIRRQVVDKVVRPLSSHERPDHLRRRFEKEREEEERAEQERREAPFYVKVFYMTDEILKELHKTSLSGVGEQSNIPEPNQLKVRKDENWKEFLERTRQHLGITKPIRLWKQDYYNKYKSLTGGEYTTVRTHLDTRYYQAGMTEAMVYVEVVETEEEAEDSLSYSDRLVFFKSYDLEAKELKYIGSSVVNSSDTLHDLTKVANAFLGREEGKPVAFWKEDQNSLTKLTKYNEVLDRSPVYLSSGDILIIQPLESDEELEWVIASVREDMSTPPRLQTTDPTAEDFFDRKLHMIQLTFYPLPEAGQAVEKDKGVVIETLTHTKISQVQQLLVGRLGSDVDPDRLNFIRHCVYDNAPSTTSSGMMESDLDRPINYYLYNSNILYYEMLPYSIKEIGRMTVFKADVVLGADVVGSYKLYLKDSNALTAIEEVQKMHVKDDEFKRADPDDILLIVSYQHKIEKVYDSKSASYKHYMSNVHFTLRPPKILDEDGKEVTQMLVTCHHVVKGSALDNRPDFQSHSHPFVVPVAETDDAKTVLKRVRKLMGFVDDLKREDDDNEMVDAVDEMDEDKKEGQEKEKTSKKGEDKEDEEKEEGAEKEKEGEGEKEKEKEGDADPNAALKKKLGSDPITWKMYTYYSYDHKLIDDTSKNVYTCLRDAVESYAYSSSYSVDIEKAGLAFEHTMPPGQKPKVSSYYRKEQAIKFHEKDA